MLDLYREVAALTPYDAKLHLEGVIDITSSINGLMKKEMKKWMKKNVTVDFKTGSSITLSTLKSII